MTHQQKSFRRGPVLSTAAAFGLATIAVLAPAAHADTDVDRPEEISNASTVGPDSAEVASGLGNEVVAETGDEAAVETGQELPDAGVALPAEADEVEETAVEDVHEQDDLCMNGALNGTTEEQLVPPTGVPTAAVADHNEGTAGEGIAGEAGLAVAAPTSEGPVSTSECAGTVPGQIDDGPAASDGDEAALPVGGVDAGIGEAARQNLVLPIGTAGVAAAAIGLGAYTLIRRSRSNA